MESSVFIDTTFRVTPAPLLQFMIIMGFDPTSNVSVPCVWIMMSANHEYLYCKVLHSIIVSLKYRWSPKLVVVDFKKALLNSVRYQFTGTRIVRFYFHFQQALHQKMIKLRIDQDAASLTMGSMTQLLMCYNDSF
ncbi:hypothetical protein MXB_5 [Myxobolus squamalis]|nr:hypothetical protein MXB_5 [Myxobolus squamalis]